MLRFALTACAAALGFAAARLPQQPVARAQDPFADARIEATAVSGSVHMLAGRGGNLGVCAGPDGLLLVDDQFAPLAGRIEEALRHLGGGEARLRFVVNTHWHGDHTGGNAHFGALAPILAHRNVRERLASRQQDLRGGTVEPAPPQALPVLTYEEGVTLHLNGEQIRILHLPGGHTDGDSVVLFSGSNVAHLGDLFFSGRFPVVDLRSGGSVAGMIRNVELLLEVLSEGVKIIPGHGPLSGIDDLRRFHRMLVETRDHVRRAMQEGRSLEQIQAAGLPSEWEPWGAGFISAASWIETIYRSEQTGG